MEEATKDEVINKILNNIEKCPAIFKSQQKDEPELQKFEKRKIAEDLLEKTPLGFLHKFGLFLEEDNLKAFKSIYTDAGEIDYCVQKLENSLKLKKCKVRNRRFEALQRLKAEGKYFSHAEMEDREPLLYYQMVGQFLSEKEKYKNRREHKEGIIPTFSNYLIDQIEKDELNERQIKLETQEAEMKRQYDSSDEDDEMKERTEKKPARWGEDWADIENNLKREKTNKKLKKVDDKVTTEERLLLFEEFTTHMHTKFLSGQDAEFDYNAVDTNAEYDCLTVHNQDEEEKYFDDETCDTNECTDTGVEDY